MDSQAAAATATYLDQYAAASENMKTNTAASVALAWSAFDGWYSDSLVGEVAEESADISRAAQDTISGLAEQYTASVIALLRDQEVAIAKTTLEPVRGGVDLTRVYRRPAETYREKVALGADPGEALRMAEQRRDGLAHSDLLLAERESQQKQMQAQQVTRFRRVVRPELSVSGTCGLCIAASGRIYHIGTLLPIHPPSCKCKTMPIVGDDDPGRTLNEEDLKRLYEDAGGTEADKLRHTRYQVNEHGEFGAVLTKPADQHRGPGDVKPLEQDPARAAQMLSKVGPVLDSLEARAAAGEDVAGPLAYQRELVKRLRRIVG